MNIQEIMVFSLVCFCVIEIVLLKKKNLPFYHILLFLVVHVNEIMIIYAVFRTQFDSLCAVFYSLHLEK